MYTEVTTAGTFLAKYLPHKSTPPDQIALFRQALIDVMLDKFAQHWDPSRPLKGNAYRAISVFQGRMDPVVVMAAKKAGLGLSDLFFPNDLVLWVDPHSVSFKVGDHGQLVTVWENHAAALESEAHEIPSFFKPSSARISTPSPQRSPSLRSSSSMSSAASTASSTGSFSPPPSPPQQQHASPPTNYYARHLHNAVVMAN